MIARTTHWMPEKALVLTNNLYYFGELVEQIDPFKVVYKKRFGDTANISITLFGFLLFEFLPGTPLSSRSYDDFTGSGIISEHVMRERHLRMKCAHDRRTFINYISAVIYGTLAAVSNSSLSGCELCRLDTVFDFIDRRGEIFVENNLRVGELAERKFRSISEHKHLYNAFEKLDSIDRSLENFFKVEESCQSIDLRVCVEMNYEASLLHRQQFPAASLILNISALEALTEEILYHYGIVSGSLPRNEKHKELHGSISSNQFSKLTLNGRLQFLLDEKFIDRCLYDRAESARIARNHFSHRNSPVMQDVSGSAQTMLRDFWKLMLDCQFELNCGWSYRL